MKELRDHGVNYKSFTEPYLDSLGPFGDVIVSMLTIIAAQDLIKVSENIKAALAKKKTAGVKLGVSSKVPAVVTQAQALNSEGKSSDFIARALNISPSTIAKYVNSSV